MNYADDSVEGRFLAGDLAAHESVVRWISRIVALHRFRMVRGERADLGQEVLKRVVDSLRHGRFVPSRDFKAYVQSIARYTARDAVVSRLREFPGETDALPETPEPQGLENAVALQQLARRALATVSDSCLKLFRYFFFEHQSYAQMSERLDVPVGTVKSRMSRCLASARQSMNAVGGERDEKAGMK